MGIKWRNLPSSTTKNNDGGFLDSNGSGSGNNSNSDADFGFLRPEVIMQNPPLVGTVEIYHRHVFLCYKNPKVWPPHVEAAEFDRLPRLLSAALLARKAEINKQTRLTICEGHDGTETSNGDVLIFPDMIRYRRLTHFDIDTFVEEVLVKDSEWNPGTPETLTGSYVFVCCHGSRDRRCGVCGPALVTRFKEEIDYRGLQGQVSVSPCSHIGGHKYAGNVIIFSRNVHGLVSGHWYGYVTPEDVPNLLEHHIGKGEIIDQLWRGQMGLSEEDQKKAQELRLQQSFETGTEKVTNLSSQTFETIFSGNGNQVEVPGCCQGNGNSSCCQNPVSAEKVEKNPIEDKKEAKVSLKKISSKQMNGIPNGQAGTCTRKVCAMPTWFETWEREDTYAALAVVGAVASVAVAYSSYKQLK
ncbi:Sucrase/ferredoxin-like family protein [Thalictrum thalictroides]|uniref:Sucrase/ferredoxin-like family protein n=1 Tax=Thalictrum thalictroides TaxID=46969 RepID=A0A7J6W2Q6_THATH|nr:Sucrase/ferredoxin-like family protein [Thalictrum thalictroides]